MVNKSQKLVFIVLMSISVCSRAVDTAYCGDVHDLFDQSEIINSQEYKNADDEGKKQLLNENLQKKKLKIYSHHIMKAAVKGGILLTIPFIVYILRKRLEKIPNFLKMGSVIGMSSNLVSFGSSLTKDFLNAYVALEKIYLPHYLKIIETEPSELHNLELEYIIHKNAIEPQLQKVIEVAFQNANCEDGELMNYAIGYGQRSSTPQEFLKKALALPRVTKDILYDPDVFNKILTGYAPQTSLNLERYAIRHVAACRDTSVRKVPAYFYGAPGIGKTRAAYLIARALSVPAESISLKKGSLDDLIGTESKPGLLLSALIRAQLNNGEKIKNLLLIFDDADRVLNDPKNELTQFLLTFFEPETKSFYSPYLGVCIDISHIGIIVCGNEPLTDAALFNRFHRIEFQGYNEEYKKYVVEMELFPDLLKHHSNSRYPLIKEDFTEHDMVIINNIVKNDTDPGFRDLKVKLMNFFEDKVLCKYFSKNKSYCLQK